MEPGCAGGKQQLMPLYFEDLAEGQQFVTAGRTITESDVVSFAAWTGDYNPLHTNVEFARTTQFGQRLVHGLLGPALCIGLVGRLGLFEGTAVALLGVDEWRFRRPVFIGDTVHCRVTITGTRLTSGGAVGVVSRRFELINHHDELTQEGRMDVMVRCAGAGDRAGSPPAAPEG